MTSTAVENRRFLGRVVRALALGGIRQFLAIGAGLPTREHVHQVAHKTSADARVLYVDHAPEVVAQGQSLLAGERNVAITGGDLRQPEGILARPEARRLLDLRQPTALLLFGVLSSVPDDKDPYDKVARLRDALAPGSCLALSHGTTRSREQIERFFTGFDLIPPGLVLVTDWRPDGQQPPSDDAPAMVGAVGRLGDD
jgi:hypothetical protein